LSRKNVRFSKVFSEVIQLKVVKATYHQVQNPCDKISQGTQLLWRYEWGLAVWTMSTHSTISTISPTTFRMVMLRTMQFFHSF